MPPRIYTFEKNLKTDRVGAAEQLAVFFEHVDTLDVRIAAISIGPTGVVSLSVADSLPADQIEHLGLS